MHVSPTVSKMCILAFKFTICKDQFKVINWATQYIQGPTDYICTDNPAVKYWQLLFLKVKSVFKVKQHVWDIIAESTQNWMTKSLRTVISNGKMTAELICTEIRVFVYTMRSSWQTNLHQSFYWKNPVCSKVKWILKLYKKQRLWKTEQWKLKWTTLF